MLANVQRFAHRGLGHAGRGPAAHHVEHAPDLKLMSAIDLIARRVAPILREEVVSAA
jgi:hypothetical protein